MYLTVKELGNYQVKAFEGKEKEEIKALISLYSEMVEEYCHTKFQETEDIFRVDVASKLPVRCTPLLEIKDVTYYQQSLIEDEDYYIYEDRNFIELEDTSRFIKRKKALTIHYTYGFKKVPAGVKKAIVDLMKLHVEGSSSNTLISQESFDSEYSWTKNTQKTVEELQRNILASLDQYKQKSYQPILDSEGDVRVMLL